MNVTRTVRWLLIPTIILAALTVLAAHAQAGERGPEEWDMTERYCSKPPIMLGNRPYPGPPPVMNSLLKQGPPPVIPPWAPGHSPKLAMFVWLTKKAYATPRAKLMRNQGWEVARGLMFCENLFAHDEHNARLQWHVIGVAGTGNDAQMREDWTHCTMVQARFPNITHSGSLKCSRHWRSIVSNL